MYNRLKTIAPAKNTTSILINKLNKVGNELPYEIYGTDDTVKSKIKLSLSMMPWREWAGSTIDSETIKSFSIEEIVAHCLYEMTFYGFSQSKIRTAGKQLRAEIRDIEDSVRFIIVSRIFPRHKTYYDVTYDSWGTEIGSATLFKRENAARAVTSLLDNSDMSVAKITVKNGSRRIIRYLDTGRIKAGRHHGRRRDFRKLLNQVSDQKPDAHDTL